MTILRNNLYTLFLFALIFFAFPKIIFAQIDVDTGVPNGDPIFVVSNLLPGDCEVRSITATNNGDAEHDFRVRSENIEDNDSLSEVLDIEINEDSNTIYSKSLTDFFDESSGFDGISVGSIDESETKTYDFLVCMKSTAGNEYQNTEVVFDLIFGSPFKDHKPIKKCKRYHWFWWFFGNKNCKWDRGNWWWLH